MTLHLSKTGYKEFEITFKAKDSVYKGPRVKARAELEREDEIYTVDMGPDKEDIEFDVPGNMNFEKTIKVETTFFGHYRIKHVKEARAEALEGLKGRIDDYWRDQAAEKEIEAYREEESE